MPSSRQNVWLITGASSALGFGLCVAALRRGDLVIASASRRGDMNRLRSAGAYAIKIGSEMSFAQIRGKIYEAVSYYGRVDFLIHNPDSEPHIYSPAYNSFGLYEANTYSYAVIQVTNAVVQETTLRQMVVVVPEEHPSRALQHRQSDPSSVNVTATAQLLASEYRTTGVRVLLVHPTHTIPGSESRHPAGDPKVAVERIVAQMVEGDSSEPGIHTL